ncbi:hypothetical protein SeLEV6574_g00186 [Synchytrium endobioticum]|uniref:Uncharacterized protein n=1 Tax=Synchytrium endobioticum TaxID=286115 RepID=A0A507DL88_9FUNG|nr:hypothetical protein SeLEV6574_g00186 [Synchytrium endobioticum]
MTNLKVNVQEHFIQMLLKHINLCMDKKGNMQRLPKGSGARNVFFARLSWTKGLCLSEDVPTQEEYASLSDLEQELLDDILTILPPVACRLSRLYEYHGYPQFQAIPLRSSLAQSHQRIDTTILYKHKLQITRAATESVADKLELWERVFGLNGKAFRSHGASSPRMISTNGTDLSVYLKHANAHCRGSTRKSKASLQAEVSSNCI